MEGGALRLAIGAWVVVLGATIGSFLNVVIARVPQGESIVWPGSRCPACRAAIAWYDNVPVLSWLLLRGRCRRCGAPISPRYVVVELAGAAAAWLAWSRHGLSLSGAAELVLADVLVALALIDLETWLLPNVLTWPLLVAGVAAGAAGASPAAALSGAGLGAIVGLAAFGAVAGVGWLVTRKEALGIGDVWLLGALGAWFGAPALLPIVLLSSVQGSVYGLALIVLGKSEPGPAEQASTATPTSTSTPTATPTSTATATATPTSTSTSTPTPTPTDVPASAAEVPEEEEWIPPRHAVPFGPFLVAGALEWLYLADWAATVLPGLRVFR